MSTPQLHTETGTATWSMRLLLKGLDYESLPTSFMNIIASCRVGLPMFVTLTRGRDLAYGSGFPRYAVSTLCRRQYRVPWTRSELCKSRDILDL